MEFEQILALSEIGCFGLGLMTLGFWILLRTHQVIDGVAAILRIFPFYNPDLYPDPHSENVVFFYRFVAVLFILLPLIPLIIIFQDCVWLQNCKSP